MKKIITLIDRNDEKNTENLTWPLAGGPFSLTIPTKTSSKRLRKEGEQ